VVAGQHGKAVEIVQKIEADASQNMGFVLGSSPPLPNREFGPERSSLWAVLDTTLPVNATSNETDLAFDAALGVDYALAPQWELGIAYQYT
jgi:hypothetical protein